MLRVWEPRSQACQDVIGDAERALPLFEPPARNGGDRPVFQQLDIVGGLRRIEIADQIQRLEDFLGAAREVRLVHDINDRAFDRRRTDRHPLPIYGHGQVVILAGRAQRFRRSDEAAGAERQVHKSRPPGADGLDLVKLGIG